MTKKAKYVIIVMMGVGRHDGVCDNNEATSYFVSLKKHANRLKYKYAGPKLVEMGEKG